MKKMKSDGGAQSTNFKGFGKGSTKGITPSTAKGKTPSVSGNTAKFSGGKKKVSK